MEPSPRLVAFDLDGTLAESKTPMTKDMGVLLARLLNKVPVAVMSGGSFPQFERQFFPGLPEGQPLGALYMFPTSGAQCYRHEGGSWKLVYDCSFDEEEQQRIIDVLCETARMTGLDAPARMWGHLIEDRGAQVTFSALGQEAPLAEKQEWHKAHDADRQKMREMAAAMLPNYSVRTGGLTSIDVTRAGITKAYGVRCLERLTMIPAADMLYVGDALYEGGNDEVVKEAGVATRQVSGPEETAGVIEGLVR